MKEQDSVASGTSLTYRDAGVNIDVGNELVERIKKVSAATSRPGVLGNLGGFGAMFKLQPTMTALFWYRVPTALGLN